MSNRVLLEDVVRCCHYLESDKATDRKKNADKLKNLIQNPQVVLVLDEKSKGSKMKDGTYTAVFKAVQGYLFKESEAARNKWDTLTVSVQSNRTVKLKEICTLLRLVSKTAVKSGPKLKCSDIVESILIILKRNFQSKIFGKTYLDILTHDILVHRKFVNQITLEQYKEFISFCTKCYIDQPSHLGAVQTACVLKSLLDSIVTQFDPIEFQHLFEFFTSSMQIVRKSVKPTFIEHSLATLNKFMRWQALAGDAEVVLLGQEILPTLVALISSKKAGKNGFHLAVKVCLFMLERLDGAENAEHCFYENFLNKGIWFDILRSMMISVEKHISSSSDANKFSSKSRSIKVDEEVCKLASKCLCVLFEQFSTYTENEDQHMTTTQFASNIIHMTMSRPSQVLSYISTNHVDDVVSTVYWLEIISQFLSELQLPLPDEELYEFASTLHQVLSGTKSNDVLCKVFQCYTALLTSMNDKTTYKDSKPPKVWERILDATIRHGASSLSSKVFPVFDACCRFLSVFLTRNFSGNHILANSTADLFPKLWRVAINSPASTQYFIIFLRSYLSIHTINEKQQYDHNCLATSDENSTFATLKKTWPTRVSLIDHFLGQIDLDVSMTMTQNRNSLLTQQTQSAVNSSFLSSGDRRPSLEEYVCVKVLKLFVRNGTVSLTAAPKCSILADILISICCKQPCLDFTSSETAETKNVKIEEIDVNFWFNSDRIKNRPTAASYCERIEQHESMSLEIVPINEVCHHVVEQLQCLSSQAVENLKTVKELFHINMQQAVYITHLVMNVAVKWKFDGSHKLISSIDLLLTSIADEIAKTLNDSSLQSPDLTKTILFLVEHLTPALYSIVDCTDIRHKAKLVEGLKLSLQCCGNVVGTFATHQIDNISHYSSERPATLSETLEDLSSGDLSFADNPSTSFASDSSRLVYRRKRYSNQSTDSPRAKRLNLERNSDSALKSSTENVHTVPSEDAEKHFSNCFKFLCVVERLIDSSVTEPVLDIMNSEEFDLSVVANVQAFVTVVKEISESPTHLHLHSLKDFVAGVQTIFKLHYQDESLSANCLNAVASIIPSLYNQDTASQEQNRKDIISVLQIISNLTSNDKCGPMVKVAYMKCLTSLSTFLPMEIPFRSKDNEIRNLKSIVKILSNFLTSPNASLCKYANCALLNIARQKCKELSDMSEFAEFSKYLFTCLKHMKDTIITEVNFDSRNLNSDEKFYLKFINPIFSLLSCFAGLLQFTGHPLENDVAEEFCLFFVELQKSVANRHSAAMNNFRKIFTSVLASVTKKFGKHENFITNHLGYILGKWKFSPNRMFEQFPFTLLGFETMKEFCQMHFDKIYAVVLLKSSGNLDEVVEFLQNVPCPMLLKDECIPHAIAMTLPFLCKNGFSHTSVAMPTHPMNILYYLMQCCDYDHISSLMQYFMAQIISHLLTMLHVMPHETCDGVHVLSSCDQPPSMPMQFDLSSFEEILTKLTNLSLKDGKKHTKNLDLRMLVKVLETSSQTRLQNLVVHLYKTVARSRNVLEGKQRLVAYKHFITLIFPYIRDDQQKEIVIHAALNCVFNLCKHFGEMMSAESNKWIDQHIIHICAVGVDLIFSLLSSSLNDDLSECWKTVNQSLFVASMAQCIIRAAQTVAKTRNFTNSDNDREIFYSSLRKLTSLLTDNKLICEAYKPTLHHLSLCKDELPCLQSDHDDGIMLDTPKMSGNSFGHKDEHDCVTKIEKWIENFQFYMQRPSQDQSLMVAGSIFDLTGTLKKFCCEEDLFHDEKFKSVFNQLMICFAQASTGGQVVKESVARCLGVIGLKSYVDSVVLYSVKDSCNSYAQVLVKIWQDCFDINPLVQSAATECLTAALQSDFTDRILDHMKNMDSISQVAKYLQVFRSTKRIGKRWETSEPYQLLNDESMWSCDRGSSRDWLCRNTCKLVTCCREEHMRCMEEISRLSPHLCEKLFPMLFHHIGKTSTKTALLMGNCLSTAFKSALNKDDGNVDQDFLLLLLRVVQYLREQTTNNLGQDQIGTRQSPKKDQPASSNTIKIDFLLAAKVANKCKRPFMSVLFIELWIDELETTLEKETESSGSSKERKSATRSLSFSHDFVIDQSEASSDQKKNKQILLNRCQGLKSPMATLQASALGSDAKSVLISSYDMIGDLDGLNGCYSSYPLDPVKDRALIHIREKEGRWDEAMKLRDTELTRGGASDNYKSHMVECLQQSGLEHLCDVYMRNSDVSGTSDDPRPSADEHLRDVQYKAAWQACQWDESVLNIQKMTAKTSTGFHQHLYRCMSSAFDDGSKNFNFYMKEARSSIISEFSARHTNHVITYDLHTVSSRLQCLKEIEDAQKCLAGLTPSGDFSKSWLTFDVNASRAYRFDDVNLVLAVRSSILRSVTNRYDTSNKGQLEINLDTWCRHLLVSLRVCCEHGHLQNAHKVLRHLSEVTSRLRTDSVSDVMWGYRVKLEGAKLLWTQKEVSFALVSLQSILGQLESTIDLRHSSSDVTALKLMLAESLQIYGGWLHESKYEGPSVIMGDYLEKSVSVVDKVYKTTSKPGSANPETKRNSLELLVKNYHMLAKFADEQYLQVIKYKKSSEYAHKRALASAPKQELESMQQSGQAPARKTMVIVDKNLNIDKQELTRIEEKARDFLSSALHSYIQCLQLSDQHDILMYRICALWLENPAQSATNNLMSSEHRNIPSHKFISLSYQLAARLNDASGEFQSTLREILYRVTVEHPYHVLNVILALANAKKDEDFAAPALPASKRKSKKSSSNKANMSARITAASTLLAKIRHRHPTLVQHTEYVMNSYIEFANFDVTAWKNRQNVKIEIPGHVTIAKFAASSKLCPVIQDVVIPICRVPVQKNTDYAEMRGLVTFRYLKPYFETVGGVNLPKVMVAVGSDGVERKHLVKGKDDLRQDAVMQQVFETVNSLLRKDHDTAGLRIRTYRVTPLSQRSGLVEWCGGTTPIGIYLVGNAQQAGAHHRYRACDTSVIKCRKMMAGVSNQSQLVKLQKYREICSSLHPVFRHFFTERFLDPAEWYAKRRSYTRSVAASSIVGYILGLGDRHVQNILVDYVTAELIHIDLGVAFEQGKCLPTPETVPFRLTRDIVDGMGATGVEGVFRRCCERTMQAMRSSYDVITTIVEVLLYDPLHEWTLTPSKAMHIQRHPTDNTESINVNTSISTLNTSGDFMSRIDEQGCEQLNTNKLAERVLLRLQEKLRGTEGGSVLSVCGQVNMLIQQASDPTRLCQLFAGWQPYL